MPENDPAAEQEAPQEVLWTSLYPNIAKAYGNLKREYKKICRDVRRRHRGAGQRQLLHQHEEDFNRKLKELLDSALENEE